MYALLFDGAFVDRVALRQHAREEITNSELIQACGAGDRAAVRALLEGFWPFVTAFEKAIDQQVSRLPIRPLIEKFGQDRVRNFFSEARKAVHEMHEEEGSHAELWRESAHQTGASLDGSVPSEGVETLLRNSQARDPVQFFCWLAGTEYIAEELATFLCAQKPFLDLFPRKKWLWGDAHIEVHEGPSHLEIDEDLARAYHPAADDEVARTSLFDKIRHCQRLFAEAAADVMRLNYARAADV